MAARFSAGVRLTDLNDFISPSQSCVVISSGHGASKGFVQTKKDLAPGEAVKVSLHDCLACSGCVTTAESVMLEQQSVSELLQHLPPPESLLHPQGHRVVVSISPQSRAALAARYQITPLEALRKLSTFLQSLGVAGVLDTSASRDVGLVEVCREFIERYRATYPPPGSAEVLQPREAAVPPCVAPPSALPEARPSIGTPQVHPVSASGSAVNGACGLLGCSREIVMTQPAGPALGLGEEPEAMDIVEEGLGAGVGGGWQQQGQSRGSWGRELSEGTGALSPLRPHQFKARRNNSSPSLFDLASIPPRLPPSDAASPLQGSPAPHSLPAAEPAGRAAPDLVPRSTVLGQVVTSGGASEQSALPPLPLLSSACPGWVCYAEKRHGSDVLRHMSRVKSPQQIMGALLKRTPLGSNVFSIRPEDLYHVTVMPCYDKKLEALRDDFRFPAAGQGAAGTASSGQPGRAPGFRVAPEEPPKLIQEVDCVLTSGELFSLIEERCPDFQLLEESPLLPPLVCMDQDGHLLGVPGGSGSYAETVVRFAARELFGVVIPEGPLPWRQLRNADMREFSLQVGGREVLKVACAYGFHNVQNIVRRAKAGKLDYHFVEVMACPGGCLSGGGQPKPRPGQTLKSHLLDLEAHYLKEVYVHDPFTSPLVQDLLLPGATAGLDAQALAGLLHTSYKAQNSVSAGATTASAASITLSPAALSNW